MGHGALLLAFAAVAAAAAVLSLPSDRERLALLERDGLIEQAAGADKRTSLAQLTRAGSTAIARALPHWESVQKELRRTLGAETLAQLSDIHAKISDAAKISAE